MRFRFDEQKATAASAVLLKMAGGHLPYSKLLAMIYVADRDALIETGLPITGATMVSTRHGPALSEILDLITWDGATGPWRQYIGAPRDYVVALAKSPDAGRLSDYEEDLLMTVHDRFGAWVASDLVAFIRQYPEWEDPRTCAREIEPAIILRAAGRSDAQIREVASQAEAQRTIRAVGTPASLVSLQPGATIIGLDFGNHLWAVLSVPTDAGEIAMANFTTHGRGLQCGDWCIMVAPGEHARFGYTAEARLKAI